MTPTDPAVSDDHPEVRVRAATPGDAATLVRFNREMARETEGRALDADTVQAGVDAVIEDAARGFFVVAEAEGAVVAALLVTREWSDWRNGEFWWIQSVYVVRSWRRRGLFRRLYRHVQSRAQHHNVCGFRLYVEHTNHTAQATYASLGLRETAYAIYEELRVPGALSEGDD